jgi:hypothetical protein
MAEGTVSSSIGTKVEINSVELTNIQSIGELQGDPSQIDVTDLSDTEFQYLPGLRQTAGIAIVCFKEKEAAPNGNYARLRLLEAAGTAVPVEITFPDLTGVTFNALVAVKLGAVAVNGAITFTVTLFKQGAMTDF